MRNHRTVPKLAGWRHVKAVAVRTLQHDPSSAGGTRSALVRSQLAGRSMIKDTRPSLELARMFVLELRSTFGPGTHCVRALLEHRGQATFFMQIAMMNFVN